MYILTNMNRINTTTLFLVSFIRYGSKTDVLAGGNRKKNCTKQENINVAQQEKIEVAVPLIRLFPHPHQDIYWLH